MFVVAELIGLALVGMLMLAVRNDIRQAIKKHEGKYHK